MYIFTATDTKLGEALLLVTAILNNVIGKRLHAYKFNRKTSLEKNNMTQGLPFLIYDGPGSLSFHDMS